MWTQHSKFAAPAKATMKRVKFRYASSSIEASIDIPETDDPKKHVDESLIISVGPVPACDEAGHPDKCGNASCLPSAVREDGMPASAVERELRRLLCSVYAGSRAYMDDGEASLADRMPHIDFMRMSPGLIRTCIMARALDARPKDPPSVDVAREELIEQAYWRFDARKKGYGLWQGRPQSERDAFKAEIRSLVQLFEVK